MPYEVCYRALLSISVVEGLKPHTRDATSKTPDLRGRPMGTASGGPEAPRLGQPSLLVQNRPLCPRTRFSACLCLDS